MFDPNDYNIPGQEHWVGLDNMYALTNREDTNMQLRIEMEKYPRGIAKAFYDVFKIEDLVC